MNHNHDVDQLLGFMYHAQNEPEDAEEILEPLVAESPENGMLRSCYVTALEKQDKFQEAIEVARQGIEGFPEDDDTIDCYISLIGKLRNEGLIELIDREKEILTGSIDSDLLSKLLDDEKWSCDDIPDEPSL